MMRPSRARRIAPLAAVLVVVLALGAACGADDASTSLPETSRATRSPSASTSAGAVPDDAPSSAVASPPPVVKRPGPLTEPVLSADILVSGQETLPKDSVGAARAIKGIVTAEPLSLASFFADEQEVTYAAVEPGSFRRFTTPGTAQTEEVWDRVASGELAVQPALGRRLQAKDGYLSLGNDTDAKRAHIGAYAQLLDPQYPRQIDAVVNTGWVEPLGMRKDNALLVSTGGLSPRPFVAQLQKLLGPKVSVQLLSADRFVNPGDIQTAVLTGGSVAAAVGSFTYTANRDGTVNPDPAWVAANIRSESVPILGKVTCHRQMLVQLRAALTEIQQLGLAGKINPQQYGGCYVPRFIARNPASGLSFHTFGTAVDLNVPGNLRGTSGEIDRRVVAVFKRWGFGWGGDWSYTDPMHFELVRLVQPR